MLTYDDVLEMCELSEEEISAIAEHEGVPEICAAEYGYYLCHTADGTPRIKRFILDDIAAAQARGDMAKVRKLRAVLAHFARTHPDRAPGAA
jgi:S-ribosylhomocysteine lyase LuxS involved in autoinducer biosynthesis